MRLILVDNESELVRCNYLIQPSGLNAPLEHFCKIAASLLEGDEVEPDRFEFGSFRPYREVGGYFVFVAGEESAFISPTTLEDVMGRYDCIGFVRRARDRNEVEKPPAVGRHGPHPGSAMKPVFQDRQRPRTNVIR